MSEGGSSFTMRVLVAFVAKVITKRMICAGKMLHIHLQNLVLDSEMKARLPLKQIWVPIDPEA